MSNTYYNSASDTDGVNQAWEAGQEWIEQSDRFEKIEYLHETCSSDFLEGHLMNEMVQWMGEKDFNEFFKHISRNWSIKTPQELEYDMHS
jgi:hypothetical protein